MEQDSGQVENVLLDEEIVRQYFKFLCADEKEIFTVCWLLSGENNDKGAVPGFGCFHGTVDEIVSQTKTLQGIYGANVSLHVTLNRTNLLGRKTGNIESARVLCVDIDTPTDWETELDTIFNDYGPDLIIESSPSKWHLYWRIGAITLEEWSTYQRGLAEKIGGDKNLDQISKTIRVPGVARTCKDVSVWVPVVRFAGTDSPMSRSDINEWFPWIADAALKSGVARKLENKKLQKAIRSGKLDAATVSESGRNNALYSYVYAEVSRFKPGVECFTLEAATAMGEDLNSDFETPLGEREVESTVRSAFENGCVKWEERRGKYMKEIGQLEQEKFTECSVNGAATNGHETMKFNYDFGAPFLAGNSFSDFGLATRLIQRFNDRLVRCDDTLLAFNEDVKCWVEQKKGKSCELPQMYGQVAFELRTDSAFEATYCMASKTDGGGFSEAKRAKAIAVFESDQKSRAVTNTVRTSSAIKSLTRPDFDSKSNLLYVGNGLLDLDTGAIRDVEALDYLLVQTKVQYAPGATCAGFVRFIQEVFEDDRELVSFVQEVFGYSLQGSIDEQLVFCHYGLGGNGKSRVIAALLNLVGGYGTTFSNNDLSFSDKSGGKDFDLVAAKIEGCRVAALDDLVVSSNWNEGTIKNLTTERIRARKLYNDSREIVNRAKVHLGLNTAPKPQAEDEGLLRRLCFIPYNKKFSDLAIRKSSTVIDTMIQSEMSGVLNWAIEGYRRWKARGKLVLPEKCIEAITEYREENFDIQTLILEKWERTDSQAEEDFYPTAELLEHFNQWLSDRGAGHKKLKERRLGALIKSTLRASEDRIRKDGQGGRGFYLKLKYEKSPVSQSAMERL